jgi:hypothetical protein
VKASTALTKLGWTWIVVLSLVNWRGFNCELQPETCALSDARYAGLRLLSDNRFLALERKNLG